MKINTKERNSSIELLRIICMLLIIAHHYSIHTNFSQSSADMIIANRVFLQIFGSFGKVSCSIFALISGYYLVTSESGGGK